MATKKEQKNTKNVLKQQKTQHRKTFYYISKRKSLNSWHRMQIEWLALSTQFRLDCAFTVTIYSD